MVRAAAKNHAHVGVVTDPTDYDARARPSCAPTARCAPPPGAGWLASAFAHTAAYDAAIVTWLDSAGDDPHRPVATDAPPCARTSADRCATARTPTRSAPRYRSGRGDAVVGRPAIQHAGIALSYLNLYDADAAWRLVHDARRPRPRAPSSSTPTRVASRWPTTSRRRTSAPTSAIRGRRSGDRRRSTGRSTSRRPRRMAPVSRPKSWSRPATTTAPSRRWWPSARTLASSKRRRPVPTVPTSAPSTAGCSCSTADHLPSIATRGSRHHRQPDRREWVDAELAWRVAARVKSNSIVLVATGQAVVSVPASRTASTPARIAAEKAAGRAQGGACASDAFFPFRDGLEAAAEAGVAVVIQPGGSVRDDEVIAPADELRPRHGLHRRAPLHALMAAIVTRWRPRLYRRSVKEELARPTSRSLARRRASRLGSARSSSATTPPARGTSA